jgi:4-amino-4-deoxy-L-arabinose transferase-like glycosyltransferase
MQKKIVYYILGAILLCAFFIRLQNIDRHDFNNDEAHNASRSVAWFDFFGSMNQTTPVQWFEERVWWQGLSFHDHPPLGFAVQFISSRVLGDSIYALRFPFVLIGVGAVFMMFLLAKELFKSEEAGLLAALLIAVYPDTVWISRLALYDGIIVLLIITSWYFFIRAREKSKYNFLLWGLSVALAILTKYTFIFMLPFFALF